MKVARLLLAFALLGVTLTASNCPLLTPLGLFTITPVDLFNDSNQTIHILSEGESFGPDNRLQPNTGRFVRERLIDGQAIVFRAGRNGQTLDTVQCTPIDNNPRDSRNVGDLSPQVIWNGAALVCVGWTLT